MLNLPILRWGQPYTSLEQDTVRHFITGETLAKVSQANTGLLGRDMRQARGAREALIDIPIAGGSLVAFCSLLPWPETRLWLTAGGRSRPASDRRHPLRGYRSNTGPPQSSSFRSTRGD
jgi:hypothetical protein